MHSVARWTLLALGVAAYAWVLLSIWQMRGWVAAVTMVAFTALLSWVTARARKRADSIEY